MSAAGHIIHFILTVLFLPWIVVWIACAVSAGNSRKKKNRELMERQTKALEEMNRINKWRGYRD